MRSEKEKSAHEAYKKFLGIMLYDVPLKQLDDLVVNDVTGYGTTLDEKILEIERLRKLVIDQREQGAGYEMNFVINPVHRRINPDNGLAVFIDEIEISMNINGDKNIIPLRFSSVLELTNDSWKVVHLHGSVAVNTEGDTWHKEEHLRKIEALEKLVSEKTEDLLTKNRELEIEASLERVRAVAMGMNKSDDLLSICEVSFKEFKKLGFDGIRNALIHIQYDEQKYFMDYDFSDLTGGAITKIEYGSHPVVEDYLKQIRSAKDAFYQGVIKEDQLEEWKNFRRNSGQIDDPRLDKATALYYYFFSIGIGDIGTSTLDPINESQIKILKRFRNVFDLAYRRYNDIALAEEQARETQIQLALERVRARTMAMQKSEELKEVIQVVYDQFVHLNIHIEHTGFILDYKVRSDMHIWLADKNEVTSEIILPYFDCAHWNSFNEAKATGKNFFANHLTFEEKNKFYQDLFKLIPNVPDDLLEIYLNYPGLAISTVLLQNVGLYIENFLGIPYSDEENKILMRFGKVFQQTYTRFLDLQKAEAQAREAQIEAALEKVRSSSMAMHKSAELADVIAVVSEQLQQLKIKFDHVSFAINSEAEDYHFWTALYGKPRPYELKVPYLDNPIANRAIEVRAKGLNFYQDTLTPEENREWLEHAFKYNPTDYLSVKEKAYALRHGFSRSFVIMPNIILNVGNYASKPYSDEDNEIIKRFAKVFEQTYTRFLDLKKAEAQAREAQIELSLERIRAQVTAMRESSELLDIVVTMRSEFVVLGHEAHYFWHMRWLPDRYEKAMTSGDGTRIGMVMSLPRHIHGDIKLVADWEKSDEPSVVLAMDVETAVNYVEKMITLGDFQQVDPQAPTLDDIRHIGGLTFVMSRTSHGEIGFSLPGTVHHPPAESITTLTRFASVFDLAYKRFEDLKSTERQHREAQIELALERTRNQSMLMQHSSGLNDISKTFHEQLLSLGIDSEFSFVWLPDEVKQDHIFWATWVSDINNVTRYQSKSIKYPLDKTEPGTAKCYMDWESGQPVHETYIPPDQIDSFFATWEDLLEGAEQFKPELFPNGIYYTEAYMRYGCFGIDIRRQLTSEEKEIIRRFSVEFERTYTRFLDLKKAEAQAREAQIETALERVRSRTMGMQRSDELAETVSVLFKQLLDLGVKSTQLRTCGIVTFKEYVPIGEIWITDITGEIISDSFNAPYDEAPAYKTIYSKWKSGEKFLELNLKGDEFLEHLSFVKKYSSVPNINLDEIKKLYKEIFFYVIYFSQGYLFIISYEALTEYHEIFKRFGSLFNQTYTRFLDFKKVEAQNIIIQAENERKTKELEDARQLQLAMLPRELPKISNLDIAVYMKTATEVGGDYYDFSVDSNGTLTVVVGDATGHGMMSGMMVSIMKSFFISNKANIELKQFFENANNSIKDMHLGRLMMSFMGVQITSHKMIATNAGMPSLIYFRNKSKKAGEFVSNNLPLGAMKGTKYSLKEIIYEKGDTILLMSDGFAELKNKNNEQYGYARIVEEFRSVAHKNSDAIVEHLNNSASEWIMGVEPDDDVTFVVIKVR